MTTEELRAAFLIGGLFRPGEVRLEYTDMDRMVVCGIVPLSPIELTGCDRFGTGYFNERRETGVINLGERGIVRAGSTTYSLDTLDCLYLGMGEKEIVFAPEEGSQPIFYLVSCPAHARYPTRKIASGEAQAESAGTKAGASKRCIYKCIHPGGVQSCQLVMGFTRLEPGSVWNTMPPHLHSRRSEIYLYTNLGEDIVVHLMGGAGADAKPDCTQSRSGVVAALVDPHGGGHTRLLVRLGDGRGEPGFW